MIWDKLRYEYNEAEAVNIYDNNLLVYVIYPCIVYVLHRYPFENNDIHSTNYMYLSSWIYFLLFYFSFKNLSHLI